MEIGDDLLIQFRVVATERLHRIESAWAELFGSLDEAAATLLERELHTLKGESQLLGLSAIATICGKLEDLVIVARTRGYAVDDDFDLVVGMAVQFMTVLVRHKSGTRLPGIDLPAFLRQIDSLLAELRPEPRRFAAGTLPRIETPQMRSIVPATLRGRLAAFALDAFIEYAMARGPRRDRLRATWHGLRDLIGIQRAILGAAQLEHHIAGALGVARELGKLVDVDVDLASVEGTTDLLTVVTTAVVHLLRNAVDHGVETPAERRRCGKLERATIRIQGHVQNERFELRVDDDGRGVQVDRVHARAVELGLVSPHVDVGGRWFDLVCKPGFSTRSHVSTTSGRGVGLDAVRAAIVELGGTFCATSTDGHGTSWTLSVPLRRPMIEGHVLRAPGVPFPVIVDASWTFVAGPGPAPVIDLAADLGFGTTTNGGAHSHFARGDDAFALATESPVQPGNARRVVVTEPGARADVVVVDGSEGLLLHPRAL